MGIHILTNRAAITSSQVSSVNFLDSSKRQNINA